MRIANAIARLRRGQGHARPHVALISGLRAVLRTALFSALCAAMAGNCAAQGSRKDDVVLGPTGRPMAGVSVAICTEPAATTAAPCSPLAALYSDSALTHALANPLASDGLGNYYFYAAPGKYTIEIYGAGITTRVLPDVILPSDPSAPTFASITTTSGISAFSLSLAGNLAVSGNTSVAGTLTVGGVPITGGGGAGTSANNIWTGNNSFKGPIPYWDLTAWCAAGSSATTTGSITAGSTTLTLASAQDFANCEGSMVPGAGPASSLGAPAALAGVAVGATGATSHTYKVAAIDALRGSSPVASVTVTNAPATLSAANYVQLAWNPVASAVLYTIYRDGTAWNTVSAEIPPNYTISAIARTSNVVVATVNQNCAACSDVISGSQVTVAGAGNSSFNGTFTVTSTTGGTITWPQSAANATSSGGTVTQPEHWYDRGAGAIAFWPANVPATPPSAATPQWMIATISSGGGTTSLTLGTAATTGVSGVTIAHDDTAAINAAMAACDASRGADAGGVVYGPATPGAYNVFGTLAFPATGVTCTLQYIGVLNVANTVTPGSGWTIRGMGGAGVQQFGESPVAVLADQDNGAIPLISIPNYSVTLENLQFGTGCNGACIEVKSIGNVVLSNDQGSENATGIDAPLKFVDACCWDYVNNGSYAADGADPAISIEASGGAITPSNLVWITGTNLSLGGIALHGQTAGLGPDFSTLHFVNMTMENASSPFLNLDSRNEGIANLDLESDQVADSTAFNLPLIEITGYYEPIGPVEIDSSSQGGDGYAAYVGSSLTGLVGGIAPCVWGLAASTRNSFGPIIQGTACVNGFSGGNGIAGIAASRVTATSQDDAGTEAVGGNGGSLNVALAAPQNCVATPATSGGSLADGTYTYFMTALNGLDVPTSSTAYESWWSAIVSATLSGGGGAGTISVACAASAGAASYKLYGRSGGAFGVSGFIAGGSPTIVDTGAALTAGSLPQSTQESGNASVVRFSATGPHYILAGNTGFGTAAPAHVIDAAGDFIRGQGGFINGGHMNQSSANSDFAGASACVSGAKTITFAGAYSSTPVILIFDETTHGGASLSAKSASSFAVACTGASDAFDYIAIGNPN